MKNAIYNLLEELEEFARTPAMAAAVGIALLLGAYTSGRTPARPSAPQHGLVLPPPHILQHASHKLLAALHTQVNRSAVTSCRNACSKPDGLWKNLRNTVAGHGSSSALMAAARRKLRLAVPAFEA